MLKHKPILAVALLAAAVVLWQLMVPPVPGVADNGDFGKMLGRYNLGSGKAFEYANTKFHFAPQFGYHSGYESSEGLLIASALGLNQLVTHDGSVDLRVMGAIHAALFLLALFLFAGLARRLWLVLLAALLFCDFEYVGFLNSFYMDVAALLFTLLAAVFYLRAVQSHRKSDAAAVLVAMLLAVTAGPHYAVMAPWFAMLVWMERGILCGGRKLVAAMMVVLLAAAAYIPYRYLVSVDYAGRNPFNAIFSQILPNSPHPGQTLAELGLDPSYRRFNEMTADWQQVNWGDAAFRKQFTSLTSYPRVLWYYTRHPLECWTALRMSLDVAGKFQSPLGNFDSGAGMPPATYYQRTRLASRVKQWLFFQHGGRLLIAFTALALALPLVLWRRRRRLPPGLLWGGIALAGAAVSMLVASALADVFDQFRHQLVSFALFDMLLLALLAAVCSRSNAGSGNEHC